MKWPWQSGAPVPDTLWWRFVLWAQRAWRKHWPWYVSTDEMLVNKLAEQIGDDIDRRIIEELQAEEVKP